MSTTTRCRTNLRAPSLVVILCVLAAPISAGELSDRFDLTWERVLRGGPPRYDQALLLADVIPEDVRRFTNFSGDLSGRYVGALAVSGQYRGAPVPALASLVDQILRHQKNDGHFGDPMSGLETRPDDMARLWGNGRLLIGLLEYHRTGPRPEVLDAARRLADFIAASAERFNAPSVRRYFNAGQFATGYVCWTQNIEGLVALHRATADERYLALAREMASRTSRHDSQHSHGFLTSLRGILHLSEVTGERKYLAQVESEWQALVESENWLVQGALPEAFAPSIERDEGCTEADWLRLNLALWRMTKQAKYLNHAERTLFNGFFMNQFSSGDFGHASLSETGLDFGGVRAWWCCTLHGLRAFPEVFQAAFRPEANRLHYDLPIDGAGEIDGLRLKATSTLGQDGRIRLHVVHADNVSRQLAVRVPEWASSVRILLRGEELTAKREDYYALIERSWQTGDSLTLEMDFAMRVERHRRGHHVAVRKGPWLLAVSEENSPAFFDEPHLHNVVSIPDAGADVPPAAANGTKTFSARDEPRFAAPAGYRSLDWAPAGYTAQRQTTILRPVSERTASQAPLRWQFWFRTQGEGESKDDGTPIANEHPAVTRTWAAPLSTALFLIVLVSAYVWRRRRR